MISRKNFLLGTLGAAGVAACGDDGAGGAGGSTSSTSTTSTSTKASASATGSGSTKASGATSGSGASTTASASGNASSSATGGMFACAAPETNIGTNHAGAEHTLDVPAADVAAGTEKTYDITGNSAHMHSLTLTAAHFTTLKTDGTVTVDSQGGQHTHAVTVTCAS